MAADDIMLAPREPAAIPAEVNPAMVSATGANATVPTTGHKHKSLSCVQLMCFHLKQTILRTHLPAPAVTPIMVNSPEN